MNTKQIKAIIINMPTYDEQVEIAKRIHDFFMYEQQAKEAAEQTIDQIVTMKKAILARVFRGELGKNDPGDECAVELVKKTLES